MKRLPVLLAVTLVATLFAAAPAGAAETPTELIGINGFPALVRLQPGDAGADVARLQEALAEKGFYPYEVDGIFGRSTSFAVVAFHKYLNLERTDVFGALDWIRLEMLPDAGLPDRWTESDYIEVDLTRQLMFIIRDDAIVRIVPVSTGGGFTYVSARTGNTATATTPQGDFHLKWHQLGWACDPVTTWCVYKYWAFTDYYGIHGYKSVPSYPASHGCVRTTTWDADWIEDYLFVGMPIHIWTVPPVILPPPVPPPSIVL